MDPNLKFHLMTPIKQGGRNKKANIDRDDGLTIDMFWFTLEHVDEIDFSVGLSC